MTNHIGPNSNSSVDRYDFPLEINGSDQKESPLTISVVNQITGVTQTTFSNSSFENLNEISRVYPFDFLAIVLWPTVISYLGFKNLAKMQKVCKLLQSVVKKDPAFQITKTLESVAKGLLTNAKELNDSLKEILIPKISEPDKNVEVLIRNKKIKSKINFYMRLYFCGLDNKKGGPELLIFLNENHPQLEIFTKSLINNFFLDNLLDYSLLDEKVIGNPTYAELPGDFIDLPENNFLRINYSVKQLKKNADDIPEKIRQQLDVMKNLIMLKEDETDEYYDFEQRITNYRDSILDYLNDSEFMSALFFFVNHDFSHNEKLVRLLFDGKIIDDENLIFAVYRFEPRIIYYASSIILKDFNFMNRLIHTFPNGLEAFESADLTLRDSQDFVLPIVKIDGQMLKYASSRLQNIFGIVFPAVGNEGQALEYASPDLRNNFQIVLAAVQQNGLAWKFASKSLQKDRQIYFPAVKNYYGVFPLLDPLYRKDEKLLILALEGLVVASKIFTAVYYDSYENAIEKMWKSVDVSLRSHDKAVALIKEAYKRLDVLKREYKSMTLSGY